MIFRGDGKNNIINGDCLAINLNRKKRNGELSAEYLEEEGERKPVTKVLMNPPFALKRDDEQEFTFIDQALLQMSNGGLLLSVIPVSVMYSGGKELAWRKRILESNSVLCVISFPNDLFYPQASVEPVIIVIKKGERHTNTTRTLFARITDDGFIKLKKRRLPHGGKSQLDIIEGDVQSFIHGGTITDQQGFIQVKHIDTTDRYLEIIPQNFLDDEPLNLTRLKRAMGSVYSELVFQQIRKGMKE